MTLQYDGVRPVVEGTLEGDTWTTTARNVWEGDSYYSPLVLRLLPSGGYNYLADGLGSTRQLMRHSDHAITDTYAYDAFGNTLTSTGSTDNPYRYVGSLGYIATEAPLLKAGARSYLPATGRFSQRDPLYLQTPIGQVLQVYAYAGNCPMVLVDPAGTTPVFACMLSRPCRAFVACIAGAIGKGVTQLYRELRTNGTIDWCVVGCAALGGCVGAAVGASIPGLAITDKKLIAQILGWTGLGYVSLGDLVDTECYCRLCKD